MPPTVDYLPFATGVAANVDTQGNYAGSGYQVDGFAAGLAQSKQLNKVWRQSSMMSAALANFISNILGISVLDDGNLAALIANLTSAIAANGSRAIGVVTVPRTANAIVTTPQALQSFVIPAGFFTKAGQVARISGGGTLHLAADANENVVLNFSVTGVGSVGIFSFSNVGAPPVGGIDMQWSFMVDLVVDDISSGLTHALVDLNARANISGTPITGLLSGGFVETSNVDLTGAVTVQPFVSFSTADGNNSTVQHNMIIEALN